MAFDFTFTVPAGRKVGNCAAKESARYSLTSVAFLPSELRLPSDGPSGERFDGGHLVATDGKILAVLPVDASGEYPGSAVALPQEVCNGNGKELKVAVNGECRATHGTGAKAKTTIAELPRDPGMYPRVKDIFAAIPEKHVKLTINADLLQRLASAVSDNGTVSLYIPSKEGPVESPAFVVGRCDSSTPGIGLIMPMTDGRKGDKDIAMERYAQLSEVIRNAGTIEFKGQSS